MVLSRQEKNDRTKRNTLSKKTLHSHKVSATAYYFFDDNGDSSYTMTVDLAYVASACARAGGCKSEIDRCHRHARIHVQAKAQESNMDEYMFLAVGMPSGWEWMVVLFIALIFFGRRLPEVALKTRRMSWWTMSDRPKKKSSATPKKPAAWMRRAPSGRMSNHRGHEPYIRRLSLTKRDGSAQKET